MFGIITQIIGRPHDSHRILRIFKVNIFGYHLLFFRTYRKNLKLNFYVHRIYNIFRIFSRFPENILILSGKLSVHELLSSNIFR